MGRDGDGRVPEPQTTSFRRLLEPETPTSGPSWVVPHEILPVRLSWEPRNVGWRVVCGPRRGGPRVKVVVHVNISTPGVATCSVYFRTRVSGTVYGFPFFQSPRPSVSAPSSPGPGGVRGKTRTSCAKTGHGRLSRVDVSKRGRKQSVLVTGTHRRRSWTDRQEILLSRVPGRGPPGESWEGLLVLLGERTEGRRLTLDERVRSDGLSRDTEVSGLRILCLTVLRQSRVSVTTVFSERCIVIRL